MLPCKRRPAKHDPESTSTDAGLHSSLSKTLAAFVSKNAAWQTERVLAAQEHVRAAPIPQVSRSANRRAATCGLAAPRHYSLAQKRATSSHTPSVKCEMLNAEETYSDPTHP